MRKAPKAIALSLAAIALCLGSVSCSAPSQESVETNTQEQLTNRTVGEAKKTLDGFFTSIASETANVVKNPEPVPDHVGSAEELAAANLSRVKAGYPTSYGQLDESSLGTAGAVKLIAFYAHPHAATPGLTMNVPESAIKIDGNTARVSGSDITVKTADGKAGEFAPGDITLNFTGGRWLISDFSTAGTATDLDG